MLLRLPGLWLGFASICCMAQTGGVLGRTVDAFTGAAVANVHVRYRCALDHSGDRETWSDQTGRFVFPDLKENSCYTAGELAGYHQVAGISRSEPAAAGKGIGRGERVRVLMARDAVIRGRVLDENDEPIESAVVEAWPAPEHYPSIVRDGMESMTDARGEYRLVVTQGEYRVTAKAQTPGRFAGTGILASQAFRFSSRHELAGQVAAAVPEVDSNVDIHLRVKTGLTISGKISGKPPGGVGSLELHVESGPSADDLNYTRYYAFKNPDRFQLPDMQAEFYRVFATYADAKGLLYSQAAEFNLDSNSGTGLELVLAPSLTVAGRVEGPRHEAVQIALISATRTYELRGEDYRPRQPWVGFPLGTTAAEAQVADLSARSTDSDAFEIADVAPNVYRIKLEPRLDLYVKKVLIGEREVQDGILDLRSGTMAAPLTVVLSDKVAGLTVKLLDRSGGPSDEGLVFLIPEGQGVLADCSSWTAPGKIGFRGVAPGRYRLVRTFETFPPSGIDSNWVRELAAGAELVEIHEGDDITLTLPWPDERAAKN